MLSLYWLRVVATAGEKKSICVRTQQHILLNIITRRTRLSNIHPSQHQGLKISQKQEIKPSGCSCARASQFYFKENHPFQPDVTSPKPEPGSQTCTLSPSYLLHFVHFSLYLLNNQCLCWQLTHSNEGHGSVKCPNSNYSKSWDTRIHSHWFNTLWLAVVL